MNASRRFLVSLLLVLPLAGCGSLFNVQRAPFTTYSPQLAATVAATGPRVDWQLIVETPLASTTLDTARIAVMPSPGVIEIFPGARWSDSAPSLLRGLVVEGFERSGRIVGVGSAASGMRADYALAIELRDFQLELNGGAAQAAIRFQARLLDYTSNRVLASQAFTASAPAAGADAASAFVAFEAGLNTVVSELVEWTLREGSTAAAR
jgi:cholesterol transport system auxiliary component